MPRTSLKENIPFDPAKWPFFYGYFIIVCSTLGFIMSAPGQTIGVSVFTDYLIDHLGISRFHLSLAYMFGTIASSLMIRRAGKLLDTVGIRLITLVTSVLLGLTLIYMSQVDRIVQIITRSFGDRLHLGIAFVMVTGGFLFMRFLGQGVLSLSSRTMLMKWFIDLRGRMNAISGVFVSVIFSGSPLVFEMLIRSNGWRGAWIILGAVIGIFFSVFVFIFYRNTPEGCGLLPDGHPPDTTKSSTLPVEEEWTLYEARKTKTFWIINIGLSMFSLFITAFTFHVVSIFEVAGLPREQAISIFLPSSVIAVVFNLLSGWMSDWKPFRYQLKFLQIGVLLGLILIGIGVLTLQSGIGRYLIIFGNGMAGGFFGNASAVIWPRYFGRTHLGEIAGYNMSFLVFFSAIGPTIFGWSFDATGSYWTATVANLFILGFLLLLSFKANKPERPDSKPGVNNR